MSDRRLTWVRLILAIIAGIVIVWLMFAALSGCEHFHVHLHVSRPTPDVIVETEAAATKPADYEWIIEAE